MAQQQDSIATKNGESSSSLKLEWYSGDPPQKNKLPKIVKNQDYSTPEGLKKAIIAHFNNHGFLNARVDSIRTEVLASKKGNKWSVYGQRGCQYRIDTVLVQEHSTKTSADTSGIVDQYDSYLDEGTRFSAAAVESEFKRLSMFLDNRGYLMHELTLDKLVTHDSLCSASLYFDVQRGAQILSSGVLVPPLEYTSPDYVRKISHLSDSTVITPMVLEEVRNRLQRTDIFREVNRPEVVQRGDSFMVALNVEELNPNKLDLLMGYQPDRQGGNKIVGDGEIALRNVAVDGSLVRLQFERMQQLTTRLNVEIEQHWIGYVPVTAGMEFNFFQQDSSYQVRRFRVNGKYWLNSTTAVIGRLTRKGAIVNQNEELQVPVLESNSLSGGLGLEYQNVDSRLNPTRGIDGNVFLDTGFKNITDDRSLAEDIERRINQRSLELDARGYLPLFSRQVLSPSMHAFLLNSKQVGEDDLYRFGGARSLRGYREDQFLARRLYWGDVEYRYLIDRSSHAFVFGAGGWYSRPELTGSPAPNGNGKSVTKGQAQESWLYSYGVGFTYHTRIGLFQFSYAISSEDPISNGKVHFGIVADI